MARVRAARERPWAGDCCHLGGIRAVRASALERGVLSFCQACVGATELGFFSCGRCVCVCSAGQVRLGGVLVIQACVHR